MKKQLKGKKKNYVSNENDMIILLILGLIKTILKNESILSRGNIEVELDLSSYATKTDFKNVTHVDISSFALKTNLASLKTVVYKLDYSSEITEIENKIPSISGLATNSALTAVENKIPDVISLVTKTDYNTKISDIEKKITDHDHDEYTTTSEINKLTTENFKAKLAQSNLVTKTDFEAKLTSLNKKISSNKSFAKHLLVENELKKLKKFNLSYFKGKDNLVFNRMYKYF